MKSNLDVWAVQHNKEDLIDALSKISCGRNIIYSNVTCNLVIGSQNIIDRQFDTFLYNEESGVLIMLMRNGLVNKDNIIDYLEKNNMEYSEVTFAPSIAPYEDNKDIPEIWFAREEYVIDDALKDSLDKGINNCKFYPDIPGNLELGYISNNNQKCDIDGRIFKGVVVLDDKIILIINQDGNVDELGNSRNMESEDILKIINQNGLDFKIITDEEPSFYKKNSSFQMIKK